MIVKNAPSICFMMLNRNYARYTPSAIRAIFAIADQECEVLFIDNGSKDDSANVARETMREAPSHVSTRVLALVPEQPLCKALNLGHENLKPDFIKAISADDRVGPNFFPTFRKLVATSDKKVGAWLGGSVIIDENDQITGQTFSPRQFGDPDDGPPVYLTERHMFDRNTAPKYTGPSVVYRRSTYEDVGGFDERFRFEDRPFFFNVLKRGWQIPIYPYNNSYYRVHSGGISADPAWMARARLPIMVDHTLRAEWRNKPLALYQLARHVRVVARDRLRTWRTSK